MKYLPFFIVALFFLSCADNPVNSPIVETDKLNTPMDIMVVASSTYGNQSFLLKESWFYLYSGQTDVLSFTSMDSIVNQTPYSYSTIYSTKKITAIIDGNIFEFKEYRSYFFWFRFNCPYKIKILRP